jgi:diguanylate cyclase (GGDEF)-like protein/PAS domain S-box-containing protein
MLTDISTNTLSYHHKSVVMVVDDDFSSRMQLRFALENAGHEVVEAASGQEAVDLFKKTPPNLILLDVVMPEMDGFETCRMLRGLSGGTHVPVVMVTSMEDTETITHAFKVGATDFISKPINMLILGYRVLYWLRSGSVLRELKTNQKRLSRAQEIARLGHWKRNLETGEFLVTCHKPEMFGLSSLATYDDLFANIPAKDKIPTRNLIDKACEKKHAFSVHYQISLPDGSKRIILNQGEVVTEDIQQRFAVGIIQDITELKRAEKELRKSEEKYRNILESIEEGYYEVALNGNLTFCNRSMCQIWGYSKDELIGMNYRQFSDEENSAMIFRTFNQVYKTHDSAKGVDWYIVRKDGEKRYIETSVSLLKDSTDTPTGFKGVVRDITERREAEDKIRYLAFYDNLTGLANRALFREHWSKIQPYAQRRLKKVAVFFIDLDHFKHINDTLGHPCGDKVLISVAERLKNMLRHSDILSRSHDDQQATLVSRVGGDEFTLLATDIATTDQIASLADRILEILGQPLQLENQLISLTASIGISVYPEDGLDIDILLKNADTAMYAAKAGGRNNYQFFQNSMNDAARVQFHLSNRLRQAMDNEEFVLYYQPQFANNSGTLRGVEALIRWIDPAKGMISPNDFLPFAEENGFIHSINDWVIREACMQAQKWVAAGLFNDCRMGINISGNNINFKQLGANIITNLSHTGLAPHFLEVELTERVMMGNTDEAKQMLLQLKQMGVSIAIDDFGTGYSALSHLQLFPLTTLKIDRSFVMNMEKTDNGLSLLDSIISIAKSFNLKVVAEGVETESQLSLLGKMDCDELQGYLLGRPIPKEELEKHLINSWAPVIAIL